LKRGYASELRATIVKLSVVPKIRADSYVSGLSFVIAEKSTAIELEHAESNGRRQIAVVTLGIDRGEQSRQRHAPMRSDLLQCLPERGSSEPWGRARRRPFRSLSWSIDFAAFSSSTVGGFASCYTPSITA
jgi:hypothetical protein